MILKNLRELGRKNAHASTQTLKRTQEATKFLFSEGFVFFLFISSAMEGPRQARKRKNLVLQMKTFVRIAILKCVTVWKPSFNQFWGIRLEDVAPFCVWIAPCCGGCCAILRLRTPRKVAFYNQIFLGGYFVLFLGGREGLWLIKKWGMIATALVKMFRKGSWLVNWLTG